MGHTFRSLPEADVTTIRLGGSYETLASEYYDAGRHPTCANFREASTHLLARLLAPINRAGLVVCDVGCGKSLVSELLANQLTDLKSVILIDSAPSMLAYSRTWARFGARMILGDAERLPVQSHSIDVLVSSLGDPYNTVAFWREAQRVTRPGGFAFFTTPAFAWAQAFRAAGNHEMQAADFELADGSHIAVPSYVNPIDHQIELMRQHGFAIREIADLPISELRSTPVSPKLMVSRGLDASVVTGYALTSVPTEA